MSGHFVCQSARIDASVARRLGHLEPMFVGAGHEEHVAAIEPVEARDRIRGDRLVGVADMRAPVGVADSGGDVERLGHRSGFSDSVAGGKRGEQPAQFEHHTLRIQRQPRRGGRKPPRPLPRIDRSGKRRG
jgi:hypothetical protein